MLIEQIKKDVSLIQRIKEDRIQAMKDKQKAKATALATLLGEIDTEVKRGKELNDALILSKIQKTIKGLDEILKLEPRATAVLNEKAILSEYLPKMMTEEEIIQEILELKAELSPCTLGDIMRYFKGRFPGKHDPKLVKELWEKNNDGS